MTSQRYQKRSRWNQFQVVSYRKPEVVKTYTSKLVMGWFQWLKLVCKAIGTPLAAGEDTQNVLET